MIQYNYMIMDCIFCKIAKGEIKTDYVFNEGGIVAVKDIKPIVSGHTVVFSKDHYVNTGDMPPQARAALFNKAIEIAETLKKELKADGYNLLIFDGEAAESGVPHRPHIHIVPRHFGDNIHIDPRGRI